MANKEVTFKIDGDLSALDRKIEAISTKIANLKNATSQSPISREQSQRGLLGEQTETPRSQQNSKDKKREMEENIRQQKNLWKESLAQYSADEKALDRLISKREKLNSLTNESVKNTKELKKIDDDIAIIKNNQIQNEKNLKDKEESIRESKKTLSGMGGNGGNNNQTNSGASFSNILRSAGSALTTVGAGLAFAGQINEQIAEGRVRDSMRQGQVSKAAGAGISEYYRGGATEQEFFKTSRMDALSGASEKLKADKETDFLRVAGATMGIIVGSALVATGAGAIAGGALIAGSVGALVSNDRMRTKAFGSQEDYANVGAKDFYSNFQKMNEANKNKDFFQKQAMDMFGENKGSLLKTQRNLGLNDQDLMFGSDSFVNRGYASGFNMSEMTGGASKILDVGGSARTAQSPEQALRLQRNMGLMNAPELTGQLSKNLFGGTQSNEAMVRILSEGTKIGLDASEMRTEQAKFAQATVDIVGKNQISTQTGAGEMASLLTSYLTNKTTGAGIEAAQSAIERQNELGREMGGATGALKAQKIYSDPLLNKLTPAQKFAAAQMTEPEMQAGEGLMFGSMITQTGDKNKSREENKRRLQIALLSMERGSTNTLTSKSEKEDKEIGAWLEKNGLTNATDEEIRSKSPQMADRMGLSEATKLFHGVIRSGMTTEARESFNRRALQSNESLLKQEINPEDLAKFPAGVLSPNELARRNVQEKATSSFMGGLLETDKLGQTKGEKAQFEELVKIAPQLTEISAKAATMTSEYIKALSEFLAAHKAGATSINEYVTALQRASGIRTPTANPQDMNPGATEAQRQLDIMHRKVGLPK